MLILSAFFSGMEIAYVSSNKIHIEIEKKQNTFLAGVLKKITSRPSKFICCTRLFFLCAFFIDFWICYLDFRFGP